MAKSLVEYYQEKARSGTPPSTEIATRQMQMFSKVMGELPNPDPILRKTGKQIAVYEELLYDDQVGHAVETLELSIQSRPWQIDDNGAGDTFADECKAMIESWDNERIFGEITSARLFGFQPIEVLWATEGGGWHIRNLVGKPQEWFFYNSNNEIRLRTRDNNDGIELAPYSFIVPRNKPSYKNPYGVAALSRCFWPVAFKKGGLKFWIKVVEKFGIPYLLGKQPRGGSEEATNKLLNSLENMIQDAIAVIPDDSSVEILRPEGLSTHGDLFERIVRYQDQAIAKAIQGQTLTSSQGDGTGSYALGSVHQDTFTSVQHGIMKLIASTYNQALAWYTEVNQGGPAPKFAWVEDEDVQKERADRDLTLTSTGQIRFTAKYWKERYNLDDNEFEVIEPSQGGNGFPGMPQFQQQPQETQNSQTQNSPPCPCGCGGDPITHFEAQYEDRMREEHPGQAHLDDATQDTNAQKRRMQMQAHTVLQPVIDLIREGRSYEEMLTGIASIYPELDAHQLEEKLARAMFVSEVWGRLQAEQEEEEDEP